MALGTTGLSARNNLCSPIRMPLTSSISSNSEASSTSISRNSAGTCSGKRLFPLLFELAGILLGIVGETAAVCYDVYLVSLARFLYEPSRLLIYLDALVPQLEQLRRNFRHA